MNLNSRRSLSLMILLFILVFPSLGVRGGSIDNIEQPTDSSSQDSLQKGTITRISVASDGTQATGTSTDPTISGNGRFVAFRSSATNLDVGDTNNSHDIFVHDRWTGLTERVSISSDGTEGFGDSLSPSISCDGRFVAFSSYAYTLVEEELIWASDIFVRDLQNHQTEIVSLSSDGVQGEGHSLSPTISADGRYVAFDSWADNLVDIATNIWEDVFVHDRQTGATELISVASDGTPGNEPSLSPIISADGRYVAFTSRATNLVSGDTNLSGDVFIHDRSTGVTERISVASNGEQANSSSAASAISADGRLIVFQSSADNLVIGDTNWKGDIFAHDRDTHQTWRISVASDGTQGNDNSFHHSLSGSGRYVTFASRASNLIAGDSNGYPDVFLKDILTGQIERISIASDGSQGNSESMSPSISSDGCFIAFWSFASNLVSGDTNQKEDIFVYDRGCEYHYLPAVEN
jgi:Tol biopolymer transport system component